MHDAMCAALSRSAAARAALARKVFVAAGFVAAGSAMLFVNSLLPATFWSEMRHQLQAGHQAYANFFETYFCNSVAASMLMVAAIWLRRDQLVCDALRAYHAENAKLPCAESLAWLHRRRCVVRTVGSVLAALVVLASLGLSPERGVISFANWVAVGIFTGLALVSLFAFTDFAYSPIAQTATVIDSCVRISLSNEKAYEKGYLHGRFSDEPVRYSALGGFTEAAAHHFRLGAAAGLRMRESLRVKGYDVDAS